MPCLSDETWYDADKGLKDYDSTFFKRKLGCYQLKCLQRCHIDLAIQILISDFPAR